MTKLPIVIQRTKTATSFLPWTTSRPQRSTSTPDLKKGKLIESFMSKRIPLGELDPNCFTPSPSQQQALSRNPGTWMANSAPRPYLHRLDIESDQPQSAPHPTRNQVAQSHIRNPTITEARPPKRVRLCAEFDAVAPPSTGPQLELSRSRFFTSAAPEPSPTVGRNLRGKRSKKQDINIFSDDSIDEHMLSLPDYDGFTSHNPRAKVTIFEEEKAGRVSIARGSQSLEPIISNSQATSQSTTPSLSYSTSVSSVAEQRPASTYEQYPSVEFGESSTPQAG